MLLKTARILYKCLEPSYNCFELPKFSTTILKVPWNLKVPEDFISGIIIRKNESIDRKVRKTSKKSTQIRRIDNESFDDKVTKQKKLL